MAKSKIDLEINISGNDSVAQAELKTKSLKTQLKEMKTLLASGTLDNNAFNKLATEAGKLQDRISDVNNEVKNLSNDSKNLTGIIGVAEGIAGGFAAVQGVTALLGDENEDLNKVMVKLQGSMAAVQGITAINNALQKDSAAMLLLANIQTKALALGQQFLKVTTMGTVAATYLLRAALIATGIGAIVVLVAALAGAFSDVAESTESSDVAQKGYNDTIEDYKKGAKEAIEKTNQVRAAFDNAKAGVISKKDALKTYNDTLGDTLGKANTLKEAEDIYNKKAGVYIQIMGLKAQANALFAKSADEAAKGIVASSEENVSNIDKIIATYQYSFGFTNAAINTLNEGQIKGTKKVQENSKANTEALYQEGIKLGTQAEQLAKDNEIKIVAVVEKSDKKSEQARADALKKKLDDIKAANERIKKAQEEYAEKSLNLQTDTDNKLRLNLLSEREREKKILKDSYAEKFMLAFSDKELTKKLYEDQRFELAALDTKFKEEDDKKKLEAIDKIKELNANTLEKQKELIEEKLVLNKLEFDKNALQKEEFDAKKLELSLQLAAKEKEILDKEISDKKTYQEQVIDVEQAIVDSQIDIAQQSSAFLKQVAGGNKNISLAALLIEKGAAIASVIINTQREISGYYAAASARSLIFAGATTVADQALAAKQSLFATVRAGIGIANISAAGLSGAKQISSGGSGSSGSGGGGSSQPAPIKGFIPQGDNNQLTGVSKVVVLEKDITDVQNRVARIRDNATLE